MISRSGRQRRDSTRSNSSRWISAIAIAFAATHIGCQSGPFWWRELCAEPRGAVPQPVGFATCKWQQAHTQAADQDVATIYQNQWREGGDELGPAGAAHVRRVAGRSSSYAGPFLIEPSGDADLDRRRTQTLVARLTEAGVADAGNRVALAYPSAEPLGGATAARVSQGYSNASRGGGNASGGSALGGGAGGGNLGGNGFF